MTEATKQAIRTSVEKSINAIEPEYAKMVTKPDYVPEPTETAEYITDMYAAQALDRQNMVNTVMLNSSLEWYRRMVSAESEEYEESLATAQESLNANTGAVIHGAKAFGEALRDTITDMARTGLTGFTDKAGHNWTAQAYVIMDMRTTAANAAREAVFKRNEDYGNALISVSSHAGARPLCYPYQGGVYSTDGSYGDTEDLHGNSVSFIPLEDTSYGEPAGLFGINCGHFPSPFIPTLSAIRTLDISKEENDRLYEESRQQRAYERRIRGKKTEADALEAAGDTQGAKAARKKAREWNKDLKAWCEEKERAYYPERVRNVKPATPAREIPLTNPTMRKADSNTNASTTTSTENITPTVVREHGDSQRNTQHELDTANALTEQIGGNAVLLDNSGSVTKPDLDWNGQKWEIKSAGSANAIDKQTQKALRQAAKTGSGIIIDCQTEDAEEAQQIVIHRLDRSARGDVPVIIMHRGEVIQSFTYKKKTE